MVWPPTLAAYWSSFIDCSQVAPRDCGPKLMMNTTMMIPNRVQMSSDREFFRIWSSMAGRNLPYSPVAPYRTTPGCDKNLAASARRYRGGARPQKFNAARLGLRALLQRPRHRFGYGEHADVRPRQGDRIERTVRGRGSALRQRFEEGTRGREGSEGDARPYARKHRRGAADEGRRDRRLRGDG